MGVWAATMEHLQGVRVDSGEGRRPGVDRETMTCCDKETRPTHLWYKRAATGIGCYVNKPVKLSLNSENVKIR